jgi:putative protease
MSELLAPAGNMEALIAAVSNGANAIYLGMNRFGARAYANNLSFEELEEAINYCHLRNVKIYVTMNTIVFDNELEDAYKQIDILYNLGVDGLIIQDLTIFSYVVENYPLLEAHTSTQMGIDDKEGTLLLKELGAKRVVLSREVPIEKIKEIKKECKIPLEIFVHGALCVSYSGGCYMSGLIGYRSGNRGRCVGSCRKPYELINTTQNESLGTSYILSMKDLKTLENINELKVADSLKVEGRMKEPVYVANIIKTYRDALDGKLLKGEEFNLTKTFNSTFTKGYIFHEDKKNIANIDKPNNYG